MISAIDETTVAARQPVPVDRALQGARQQADVFSGDGVNNKCQQPCNRDREG
jgi:hypothetical protein